MRAPACVHCVGVGAKRPVVADIWVARSIAWPKPFGVFDTEHRDGSPLNSFHRYYVIVIIVLLNYKSCVRF